VRAEVGISIFVYPFNPFLRLIRFVREWIAPDHSLHLFPLGKDLFSISKNGPSDKRPGPQRLNVTFQLIVRATGVVNVTRQTPFDSEEETLTPAAISSGEISHFTIL
jgi:hypothetical protein